MNSREKRQHAFAPITNDGPGIPLYRLVKRSLLAAFEAGLYGPGESLPNEVELAGQLGVAIGTLRRAVDELVTEHILVRRQGRGTFVTTHNADRFLFQFFHVERNDGLREYPKVDMVAFERIRMNESAAAALQARQGDPAVQIEHRLTLQGRAVVHDRIVLPTSLFKGITEKRVRERPGTIYRFFQSEFAITVVRAQERARAGAADRTTSRILNIPVGLPVIHVYRTSLTFGERPVEFRHSTIDTSRHDYVNLLTVASIQP